MTPINKSDTIILMIRNNMSHIKCQKYKRIQITQNLIITAQRNMMRKLNHHLSKNTHFKILEDIGINFKIWKTNR